MNNLGPRKGVVDRNLWHSFDRLPPELRKMVSEAPYKYAVTPMLQELNGLVVTGGRRWAVEQALRDWPLRFASHIARDALEIYGPDHPQAARGKR
jgi:hypothetical protein